MPLYGFICDDCTEEFEELVMSASKVDSVVCPSCGSPKVQRQLSLVAGIKGSSTSGVSSQSSCSTGGG
ncbi:zinc ribbon domain-containing protein [bacterium]|nr:zinc ribbon domain-containing protein [bacterium]